MSANARSVARLAALIITTAHCALSGAEAGPPAGPARGSPDQVIITFKTHFDIGYTDMASKVVERYRTTMIDQALRVCDESRDLPTDQQFVWMMPGWPMHKILEDWPGQTADRRQRVLNALGDGRFAVHALPFTTHTELLEPEDLVRGLGFASRLTRLVGGQLPRDAKMTDVPSHSWILPTLLRNAGVDFLHLGCNAASSSPQVPRLFWWEGPDGSRLLTMYTAESYGTGLVPPLDWPYRTWLALIHTGDNHGPPTPEEVRKLLNEARMQLPGVKVRIGRLSDFANAIRAETTAIPVVRGDMPDTWIHGPMSDPAGGALARNLRPRLFAAEALNTLLRAWHVDAPAMSESIPGAYEQSLLYGEHTWGGALYWVTQYSGGAKWAYGDPWQADHRAGRFKRLEDSWAEHTGYIETADTLVRPLLEHQLDALARSVRVTGSRIVVFNPLPWRRADVVTVTGLPASVEAVRPVDGGEPSLLQGEEEQRTFVARNVPALGYATYVPVPRRALAAAASVSSSDTLENRRFKLILDPEKAAVRSLIDQRTGRELVRPGAAPGFGQYLYERFDSNQVAGFVRDYVKINADWAVNELGKPNLPPATSVPYRGATPDRGGSSSSPGLARALSRPTAALPHEVILTARLHPDLPFAELELKLLRKPADPWPEAGWMSLPLNLHEPRFRMARLGSVVDPATDLVPGSNHQLFALNGGLAVIDSSGHGVGLCAIDSPLVSLGEPGCWRYTKAFGARPATVYVNLFNNQWTTNFRLWNDCTPERPWTSRVRVWTFDRYDPESALTTPSSEARYPLLAAVAAGPAGQLPASQTGLELSRKGVLVTAFGPNPDGPGNLLRLWDQSGVGGACKVSLPAGLSAKTALPVDLRGRPQGAAVAVRGRSVPVTLRPWAPASFILQP